MPWRAIAAHPPFRKLLRVNVACSFAYGGMATFTVAFLRVEAQLPEGTIMLVTALAFLGGLAGLAYFESRTDRLGSKPVLMFCLALWLMILLGWLAFAGRVVRPGLALIILLQLLMGSASGPAASPNCRRWRDELRESAPTVQIHNRLNTLLRNHLHSSDAEPVTLALQRPCKLAINANAEFAFRNWGAALIANLHRNLDRLPQLRLGSYPAIGGSSR